MFVLIPMLLGTAVAEERTWEGAHRQLPDLPGLHDRWDGQRSWGTSLMVRTLVQASERLAWERPDLPPITIGDISTRGGGPMAGHRTHDLGIDADIGLFLRNGRPQNGFHDVRPAELDVEATWSLIQALLDTGNVQFILLDQRLMDRLRAHLLDDAGWSVSDVDAIFVSPSTRLSADRRGVIRHAPNHASHIHVRVTSAD